MSDLATNSGDIESTEVSLTTGQGEADQIPETGTVSAEDLQAYVDERFGSPDTDLQPPEDATQAQAEVEPEGETETQEPTEEPEPQPTSTLTPERIQAFEQFDNLLRTNPQLGQLVNGVLNGQISLDEAQEIASQAEVPVAAEPPPDLDLDDPAVRHLYEQHQAQARQLQELNDRVVAHDDFLNNQQRETSASLVNRARASFQQQYELDDIQMERLEQTAAGLQILPALARGFNPSTGQYESPDTLAAIERALEVAYWTQPENREREYQRQMNQRTTDNKRKQKLAAVSGNSGSVPRSSPAPQTQEGRRQAMIQEVATAMSGNTVSGE
jgi:hypothetical protein